MATNLNAVIVREAGDDFFALKTADAMQSLSYVDVVSVVFQSSREGDAASGTFARPERWHVFAKYASDMRTPDDIDAAIDAELDR